LNVSLSCNSTNAVIRYTTNGSDPVESSQQYTTPLSITKTTVIKAGAFEDGLLPGKISTHTYIINDKSTLPVISIATDPDGFFSSSKGIYVNYNEETWERPIHLEFFESDGRLGFSIDAGSRIQGKSSSRFAQKPLSIFVRGQYGYDAINYQIFPDSPVSEFKSLILRNSGNDWSFTMFRDGLTSSLFRGVDLDIQEYRPTVVYINGEYWGIHNIREKHNEEYFESHHSVDPDNIDLLKPYWRVERPDGALLIEGDYLHYDAMLDYMTDNDLSISEHYNYIKTQLDIPSYINYLILEIYGDNKDWTGNNMKLWRPKTSEGKWRWLPWDLDFTFGGQNELGYERGVDNEFGYNTLAFATDPEGGWPYPPWTTFIFRKLLENQSFRNDFINRFADCFNTFLQNHIVMQKIHEVKSVIEPEMQDHIAKWGNSNKAIKSVNDWYNSVKLVEEFGETRADSIRIYIIDEFNLSGTAMVDLDIPQPGTGTIRINTLSLDEFPWSGTYFKGVPVVITAQPAPGYRFAGWSGIAAQDSISIDVNVNDNLTLTAHFEAAKDVSGPIVINEINYNSSTDFNPEDWVELYNTSTEKIELSGWVFKDEDDAHKFVFPDNTVIEPDDYIVLCRDKSLFHQMFPDIEKYIGDISFGLSGRGELVRLYNAMGELVNSLTYDNNPPWPEAADGRGSTLELLNPSLDNILPGNWAPSISHGTPGEKNDVFITGVENTSSPAVFSLGQNYPNPFNPVTTIPFHVSHGGRVTIDVYSVLGQRVATVIDRDINPGHHTVIFSSDDLAAGLYFYTIKTGRFIKTKQMMLLK
ncbi:MAG: T9SS type A sorting domain-containing protein, partial [Candidatus Latescibacteria bacterium]|nr:T9SS type A sorting domain-containing protein [Candidatus Latescibacterota bacterium]